mgnify:CR=1 FL=1
MISEIAVIGDRVEISAGVILGGNATEFGAPVIEDDFYLGEEIDQFLYHRKSVMQVCNEPKCV